MSKRKLSRIFQIRLLLAVLICFLITLACLWKTQKSIARSIAYETMLHNIDDTLQSIQDISDSTIIGIAKKISQKLDSETGISENLLTNLCEEWQINEINVINADGIITQSTNKKFIGYSMASGTQSAEFMPILRGEITEFAQKYQPISYDPGKSMKYAGAALKKGGFAQIGYSGDNFNRNLEGHIKDLVKNRRVGILGTVIIVDENWDIIGETVLKDYTESIYKPDKIKEFISNLKAEESSGEKGIEASPVPGEKNRSGFSLRITDKEKDQEGLFEPEINEISFYALMHKKEGFAAIALLPKFEQSISNFVALFVLVVLEFIVFLILFFTIYYLVQKIVVSNLNRINVSLDKITKGNLDETVSVNYSREFEKLSGGINAMVASLKRNIKETAARIDEELAFAKAVQHSSMPSVFPPFPDRKDFDIFAMMETAKEVGGDFYDFYFIGKNKFVFLIADVSGKGIPAAM
ncbi:MAG: hypothetical protein J5706_07920, partial [Elusimicrobiales bacterium]|nr:hypothetical protein [Elusimicrobiales bacterium]